jgi:hypothetical protein
LCERAVRSQVYPAGRGSGGALLGRRPTDLARVQACRKFKDSVNKNVGASSYIAAANRGGRHYLNLFSKNVDTNRPFKFQKRSQLFIGTHNEALAVAVMRVIQSRSFARWNQSLRHSLPVRLLHIRALRPPRTRLSLQFERQRRQWRQVNDNRIFAAHPLSSCTLNATEVSYVAAAIGFRIGVDDLAVEAGLGHT